MPVVALAASLISTSSRTIYGDLPPSSNDTFLKSLAAFSIILEPVGPDPVNDIMRTLGCSDKGFPTPAPSPLTRLNTPLGTPTLSKISAKITAANAAANFNDVWFVGKFHGVINPDTPIASLTTKSSPRRSSNS